MRRSNIRCLTKLGQFTCEEASISIIISRKFGFLQEIRLSPVATLDEPRVMAFTGPSGRTV
jgi:hypothetical protein